MYILYMRNWMNDYTRIHVYTSTLHMYMYMDYTIHRPNIKIAISNVQCMSCKWTQLRVHVVCTCVHDAVRVHVLLSHPTPTGICEWTHSCCQAEPDTLRIPSTAPFGQSDPGTLQRLNCLSLQKYMYMYTLYIMYIKWKILKIVCRIYFIDTW